MKNLFMLLVFTLLSSMAVGQINFEKGYYKDNSGMLSEVLIENKGWRYNPTEFLYKLQPGAEAQENGLEGVSEFGIGETVKYLRATVEVEQSYQNFIDKLDEKRTPVFSEETVFLKILVEGAATLYLYRSEKRLQFFFQEGDSEILPLVYKRYMNAPAGRIAENTHFRQQLFNALKCEVLDRKRLEDTEYSTRDLTKLFVAYNRCTGQQFTDFEEANADRDAFHLKLKAGLRFNSLKYTNNYYSSQVDFGTKLGFNAGLELEYILPFNRNKWAIFLDPNFQYFSGTAEFDEGDHHDGGLEASYSSIEIPLGLRHYFYLSERSRFFVNGSMTMDFTLGEQEIAYNSSRQYDPIPITTNTFTNFSVGAGFSQEKYSVEVRYNFNRTITNLTYIATGYSSFGILFGYELF